MALHDDEVVVTAELERRLRALEKKISNEAMTSRDHHRGVQATIYVGSMFGENNEPQDVTVGIRDVNIPNEFIQSVVIPHHVWNLLTAGWEHAAEAAAYFSDAGEVINAFPEVFK